MLRSDINRVVGALTSLSRRPLPVKAAYAVAKNLAKAEAEAEAIEKSAIPKIDGLEDYDKERKRRLIEYSRKDEEGNAKTIPRGGGNFVYDIDPEELEKVTTVLAEDYPEITKAIKDHNESVADFLQEEADIKWHTIQLDWFGDNPLQASELTPLIDLISDGE